MLAKLGIVLPALQEILKLDPMIQVVEVVIQVIQLIVSDSRPALLALLARFEVFLELKIACIRIGEWDSSAHSFISLYASDSPPSLVITEFTSPCMTDD